MTICEAWAIQVSKNFNKTAIVCNNKQYTYNEIDCLSNSIAQELINNNVKPENIIGLFFSNSVEYVISVIATLKAGAAFLPLDTDIPQNRLELIIKDCGVIGIIHSDKKICYKNLFCIDVSKKINPIDTLMTKPRITPDNLAYIMYTSGTTGRPKGVMVEHKNVMNMSYDFNKAYSILKHPNAIQLSNISFDVSINEIFGTLLNGGVLYIPDKKLKYSPTLFHKYMINNHINILQATPSLLALLFDSSAPQIPSLKIVISGGEPINESLKNLLLRQNYRVFNHYGPTECTVYSTRVELKKSDISISIGKSISNVDCFIIDEYGNRITELNKKGQLCISGECVSRGYYNDILLTRDKFIQLVTGDRMYKTGDIVSLNINNEFVFWGRKDNQIKINGVRVDLEEIENCMSNELSIICKALYIKSDGYGSKLILFHNSKTVDNYKINNVLKNNFTHIVFDQILFINRFPYTVSGKIDKNELLRLAANPENNILNTNTNKTILSKIKKIINNSISTHLYDLDYQTEFKEIGLNSLSYIELIVDLEKEYNIVFDIEELTFDNITTIEALISIVNQKLNKNYDYDA